MAKTKRRDRARVKTCCERPCCQELLQEAMMGALPADQCLERMLDHLERAL